MKRTIDCASHGKVGYGIVCEHLFAQPPGVAMDYFVSDPDIQEGETDAPCVWCAACDEVLMREGEWNDVSEGFSKSRIVCVACLQDIMARNTPGAD